MADYTATLETPLPQEAVFAYLSDFANAEEWDPGVVRAELLGGDPIGPGSEFRLVAAFLGRETVLRYVLEEYDPPSSVSFRGENATVVSLDRVTVAALATGSRITYDAELTLKGPLRLADPLLAIAFRRVGDRALAGMRATLAAERAEREPRTNPPART